MRRFTAAVPRGRCRTRRSARRWAKASAARARSCRTSTTSASRAARARSSTATTSSGTRRTTPGTPPRRSRRSAGSPGIDDIAFEFDGPNLTRNLGYDEAQQLRDRGRGDVAGRGVEGRELLVLSTLPSTYPLLVAVRRTLAGQRQLTAAARRARQTVLLFVSKWANYCYREPTEWLHDAQFGAWHMLTSRELPGPHHLRRQPRRRPVALPRPVRRLLAAGLIPPRLGRNSNRCSGSCRRWSSSRTPRRAADAATARSPTAGSRRATVARGGAELANCW